MKIKRIAICLLILCLAVNAIYFPSFNISETLGIKAFTNTDEDYGKTVSAWSKEMLAVSAQTGEFSITDEAATPGQRESIPENYKQIPSDLTQITKLKYYYEGSNYAYGICSDDTERIAILDLNGTKVDAVNGAGAFALYNSKIQLLLENTTVKSFEETVLEDGIVSLEVLYNLNGLSANTSSVSTIYTFLKNSIEVKVRVSGTSSDGDFCLSRSKFTRPFTNGYYQQYMKVNSEWVYPDDLDDPYQKFESLAFLDNIDGVHKLYTFFRGDHLATTWCVEDIQSSQKFPIDFTDDKTLDYEFSYQMAMGNIESDIQNPDYLGLFKSKDSDFAAGVAAITKTDDNSTVFVGKQAKINLNVTNLLKDDLKFSLRYDVRDSYGNIVDSGLFIDNVITKNGEANRTVNISGYYGMYYLNLYVISENSSYKECYPFALLEDYTYKYNATSPFGIASANGYKNKLSQFDNLAAVCAKIGVANARISTGNHTIHFMHSLIKNGINRFNGLVGPVNDKAEGVESYVETVAAAMEKFYPYVQYCEIGNEMSLYAVDKNEATLNSVFDQFYNYTHLPALKYLQDNYPDVKYVSTSISAADTKWIDKLKASDAWDTFDAISIHIYGNPIMPDRYGTASGEGNDTWNIEAAINRASEGVKNEDGVPEKDIIVTEVGYPTPAESDYAIGLRAQADYTAREVMICLAYGADIVEVFNLTDRRTIKTGYDNTDIEMNYGLFYEPDFFDVIKPKPSAVAFAVMSRQLESLKKDSTVISSEYDEGYQNGGVRAFVCDTELHGKVIFAYSNKETLTNGKKLSFGTTDLREPRLPWNSIWSETDDTVFEVTSDTVKVVDFMGNTTEYKAENGKVTIPLTGSPVYIYGV